MATTDEELLSAELIKFNAFLASEKDKERQGRDEKTAVKRREKAAAHLKSVMADTSASKEDKEAAESAWKDAIAAEERVKGGGPLDLPKPKVETPTGELEAGDTPVAELEAGDAPVAELEAGDTPVAELEAGD